MGLYFEDGFGGYSEKFIKMCEFAKDIQRQWNFKIEDYIFDPADGEARVWFGYPSKEYVEMIWLPRQDQYKKYASSFTCRTLGCRGVKLFFIL